MYHEYLDRNGRLKRQHNNGIRLGRAPQPQATAPISIANVQANEAYYRFIERNYWNSLPARFTQPELDTLSAFLEGITEPRLRAIALEQAGAIRKREEQASVEQIIDRIMESVQ